MVTLAGRFGGSHAAVFVTAAFVAAGVLGVVDGPCAATAADAADSSPSPQLSRADIRDRHGPPDAWAILYFDEPQPDDTWRATSIEQWSYYDDGVEYTFAGEELVGEVVLQLKPGLVTEAVAHDPDRFAAYMTLDEVVAAAGLSDYVGGSVTDLIEGGETWFADGLTFGLKDGELRYIEALAFAGDAAEIGGEDP